MFCSQCGSEVPADARFCRQCGTSLEVAQGPPPAGGVSAPSAGIAPPSHAIGAAPPPGWGVAPRAPSTVQFDISRLKLPDFVVAGAAFLLMISVFFPWYSFGDFGASFTISSVTYHGWMYLVFFLTLGTLAYLACKTLFVFEGPIPHPIVLVIASSISLLLTLIAFVLVPSGWSWAFGAFFGLLTALGMLGGSIWRLVVFQAETRGAPAGLFPAASPAQPVSSATAGIYPATPPQPPASTAEPTNTLAFSKSCPSCASPNPAKNRFCNGCGSALEAT
jgi:hypothetical protein